MRGELLCTTGLLCSALHPHHLCPLCGEDGAQRRLPHHPLLPRHNRGSPPHFVCWVRRALALSPPSPQRGTHTHTHTPTGLECLGALPPLPAWRGAPHHHLSPGKMFLIPQGKVPCPPPQLPGQGPLPRPLLHLSALGQEALPSLSPRRRAPSPALRCEAGPLYCQKPLEKGGSSPLPPPRRLRLALTRLCRPAPLRHICCHPPRPPPRSETLPGRRHGNTRHHQGSPAPPSPAFPPAGRHGEGGRRERRAGGRRPGKAFPAPRGAWPGPGYGGGRRMSAPAVAQAAARGAALRERSRRCVRGGNGRA